MGNQQGQGYQQPTMEQFAAAGGIYLQTGQANYATSQRVDGNIFLQLVQPLAQMEGIWLSFTGYESVSWEQEKTRQVRAGTNPDGTTRYRTERYMERHHAHHQFFNSRMLVHNYQGPVMPGQYQFPFSFQLPDGLPGDFEEQRRVNGTDSYRASIRYTLTAECQAPGWRQDIVSVQPIIVDEHIRGSLAPVSEERTASVRFCCCIPRGDATMKVTFDKTCYMPGETAQIICEANNRSKVDFRAIVVKLTRRLKLVDNRGASWNITETLFEQKYPGVKVGEVAEGEAARNVPIAIVSPKDGLLQPQTTRGKYVTCRFHVIVEYDIPYCPDIQIRLPIEIYQLCQPNWGIQQAPAFWQPQQVYAVQQVAFDLNNPGPALQFNENPMEPAMMMQQQQQ